MKLWSDSWPNGERIPPKYACGRLDGASSTTFSDNVNPHLGWSELPPGTKSLVLICHDFDVPSKGDDVNQVGREPAPKGIIEVAALPGAIRALEEAIAAAELARRDAKRTDDDDDERGAEAVGLAQRAWPMLEMMRRSLAERADIVWGV